MKEEYDVEVEEEQNAHYRDRNDYDGRIDGRKS